VSFGVSAGRIELILCPSRLIATSTTLFSFSLLRPITSEAMAKAKLPMAAHCVPVSSSPQMFIVRRSPLVGDDREQECQPLQKVVQEFDCGRELADGCIPFWAAAV